MDAIKRDDDKRGGPSGDHKPAHDSVNVARVDDTNPEDNKTAKHDRPDAVS